MKKIFFLLIFASPISQSNKGIAQVVPSATVMQYLRSNIEIRYVSNPNAAPPVINPIPTQTIANNTDGILFGSGGNNYMTQSARLLLSLFKDRGSRAENGQFQDMIYRLLKLRGKPIIICFFNDVIAPFNPGFMNQYGFIDTFRVGGTLHIWPTTVEPASTSLGGTIFIGEQVLRGFNTLRQSQSILLDLITSVAIADYREMHRFWVFDSELNSPNSFLYTYSLMDSRQKTNQGICNAMRYAFDIPAREKAILWTYDKTSFVNWHSSPVDARSNPDVPLQFWLYDELKTDGMLNRGATINNPPLGPVTARDFRQIHLTTGGPSNFNPEMDKYTARDETMLGVMLDAYRHILGYSSLLNALKYDNNRLFNAPPERRLSILIENLCLSNLDGRTLQDLRTNPPTDKRYLLGIALFDFISRYGSGGNATEIRRWMLDDTAVSPELLTNYISVRTQIIEATSTAAPQQFLGQLDAIKATLHIP